MVAPPSNVHIRVLSPDSILVTWADPIYQLNKKQFGGLRRYYTMRYREREAESETWSYRTSARPRVRLENLTPNGSYEFSVRVSNGQHDGSWCQPVYKNIMPGESIVNHFQNVQPQNRYFNSVCFVSSMPSLKTLAANLTATPIWETGPISPTPSSPYDDAGKRRYTANHVNFMSKEPKVPCSVTEVMERMKLKYGEKFQSASNVQVISGPPENVPRNVSVLAVEGCHSFVVINWLPPENSSITEKWLHSNVSNETFLPVENLQPEHQVSIHAKCFDLGFLANAIPQILSIPGTEPIWIQFPFKYDKSYTDCYGKQYVKRTWYRKFVGIVLCNSLRYKIFISDKLQGTFENIGDGYGYGEDHCEFVDSFLDGRTGPLVIIVSRAGYYRRYRQQPLKHGVIGGGRYSYRSSGNYYVAWYECGAPIPGNW
uniref:Fibronectin type-III domain-containing protein n=1 Tax=Eptatretus burgeri TaxID=7764 RepID=A0A8C4X1A3_EPTBU